jgi:ADP-dependent phosphofructokinase/glucokinase
VRVTLKVLQRLELRELNIRVHVEFGRFWDNT